MASSSNKRAEEAPKKLKDIPTRWEGIIAAPIDENDVDAFLRTIELSIDQYHIPNHRHFHLLLYLSLTEPPPTSTHALRILSHIFSIYSPSTIGSLIPHMKTRLRALDPDSLQDGLDSRVSIFLAQAQNPSGVGGIWGLLGGSKAPKKVGKGRKRKGGIVVEIKTVVKKESKGKGKAKGKRRKDDDDVDDEDDDDGGSDDEDDDGEKGKKEEEIICENGWKLLMWLIRFWKLDQVEHTKISPDEPWSPLFLAQLPHPYANSKTLQLDDAAFPLAVIRSGITQAGEIGTKTAEAEQKLDISRNLLELVISPALPIGGKFHPASLLTSLLSLLRPLSPPLLRIALPLLPQTQSLYAHILSLLIEDLAGIRISKVAERKRNFAVLGKEFDLNWTSSSSTSGTVVKVEGETQGIRKNFPPPKIGYFGDLLLLQIEVKKGMDEDMIEELKRKMGLFKVGLCRWMICYSTEEKDGWRGLINDEKWIEGFKGVMVDKEETEEVLGMIKDLIA